LAQVWFKVEPATENQLLIIITPARQGL